MDGALRVSDLDSKFPMKQFPERRGLEQWGEGGGQNGGEQRMGKLSTEKFIQRSPCSSTKISTESGGISTCFISEFSGLVF